MERKLRLCEDKRLHLSECSECPDLEDQIEKAQQCCDNAQSRIDTVEEQKASKTEVDTAIGAVESAQAATNQRVDALENGKQDKLVSGVNIKTVNNNSLLGSGNINISGGGSGVQNWVDGSENGSVRTSTALTEDSSYSLGEGAVAEGISTGASGDASHAEGRTTTASGIASHAEGSVTIASGDFSHAGGVGTTAQRASQQVFGEYNTLDTSGNNESDKGDYVEIVGNGTDNLHRSNARTLDWDGNEVLAGTLTVGADPTDNMEVATKQYVDAIGTGMQDTIKDYVRTADYVTCSTPGSTVAKAVSITGITSLENGMTINVRFANGNTASNPTMNLNSLGSKPIYRYGNTPAGNSEELSWYSGEIISLVYSTENNVNGCWVLKGWNNTTYSSLAPASGGADESLVTTGEKYTWNSKQDELVSGTNIKTINNQSLLGSGNISIGGGGGGGDSVSYTQTQTSGNELGTITINGDAKKIYGVDYSGKQDALVSGTNIKTINNTSLLGSGNINIAPDASNNVKYDDTVSNVVELYTDGGFADNFYNVAGAQAYADTKQEKLVSGTNIKTVNSTSLLGSGDIAVQPTLVSGTNIKTINNRTLLGSGNFSIAEDEPNNMKFNRETSHQSYGTVVEFYTDEGDDGALLTDASTVQPTLVSGTNIKTVNSTSLLGSGNVAVQPTLVSGTNIKTVNSTSLLGSGNVAVQPTLVSGTNIKTINNESLLGSGNISIQSGTPISTETVTLAVADWNATTTCTKSVTGVTASNSIIVSPAPASMTDYTSSGVYCSAQANGTLTFTASSTPSADITVNVMIVG